MTVTIDNSESIIAAITWAFYTFALIVTLYTSFIALCKTMEFLSKPLNWKRTNK